MKGNWFQEPFFSLGQRKEKRNIILVKVYFFTLKIDIRIIRDEFSYKRT